ncbi:MAG: ankyrin repeat domain-containing protein [Nitrospirales bacterium]
MIKTGLFSLVTAMIFGSLVHFAESGQSAGHTEHALLDAVHRNDVPALKRLLQEGVALDTQDSRGRTALMVAVDKNYVEAGTLLIEAGANVNVQDHQQDSPFLLAGARGNLEILKPMLKANPDFRLYNRYGGTALIPASERGHVEVVKLLLGTPMDVNHVNRLGWTALLEAIILGNGGAKHQAIVRLLIEAGANVNLPDGDGIMPLQHARNKGFGEIVALLETAGAR